MTTKPAPSDGTCTCGHPASEHALLDHDERAPLGYTKWRREQRLARWHWICQADAHPDGEAESPWDHVCGCIHSVWDHDGHPTIYPESAKVKELLREAMGEWAPA